MLVQKVVFVGQVIGAIVAETKAQADNAVNAVVVHYGKEQTPIVTIEVNHWSNSLH